MVVFAHRGFTPPFENSIGAFERALDAGADYIETDVRATKDGIAVLCHDQELTRIAGVKKEIAELNLSELIEILQVPTLLEALNKFPTAKFNIDIKETRAIDSTVSAIETAQAHHRVLVSSFSNSIRVSALSKFTKPVATSASSSIVIKVWLRSFFGLKLDHILSGIGALQVPTSRFGMKFDSKRFISSVSNTGTQIHFWTINQADQMRRLVALGAHGIITDKTDLAVKTLRKTK